MPSATEATTLQGLPDIQYRSSRQVNENIKPLRIQRPFHVRNDDSLLRPYIEHEKQKQLQKNLLQPCNPPTCRKSARATPKRPLNHSINYDSAQDSPNDDSILDQDSDWQPSSEGDSEADLDHSLLKSTVQQFMPRLPSTVSKPLRLIESANRPEDLQYRKNPRPVSTMGFNDDTMSSSDSDDIDIFSDCQPLSRIKSSPLRNTSSEMQLKRPVTPPASPRLKTKLASPKKLPRIPPTPHCPSIDSFWSQDVINDWNEQYSPRKTLNSPLKIPFSKCNIELKDDSCSPLPSAPENSIKKRPVNKDKTAVATINTFEASKRRIAEDFLRELDYKVTGGEVQRLAEAAGGVQLIWSRKLNSTAGRANWRREALKAQNINSSASDNDLQTATGRTTATIYRHAASIELAEKVIDDEGRLLNVLAHEYCHLANFMISNVKDQPHGASFKAWATKVTKAFKGHNGQVDGKPIFIEVTTKHSYAISYKYAWECTRLETCGILYERHSRSIDPTKHTCGKCKGKLTQVRPVPRRGDSKAGTEDGETKKSVYQLFVKENFGFVKKELGPSSPHKDVMKELGVRYRKIKEVQLQSIKTPVQDEIMEPNEAELDVDKVSRVLDFLSIRDD